MRRRIRVHAGAVPNQAPSIAEREHYDSIRTPAITPIQSQRLQNRWKACSLEGTSDKHRSVPNDGGSDQHCIDRTVVASFSSILQPHLHRCPSQTLAPSLKAMPILRTSGSNCVGEVGVQWDMVYKTRNLGYFEDSFEVHMHLGVNASTKVIKEGFGCSSLQIKALCHFQVGKVNIFLCFLFIIILIFNLQSNSDHD